MIGETPVLVGCRIRLPSFLWPDARHIQRSFYGTTSPALWKGSMPWHRWLTGSKGISITKKYLPMFNQIEAVKEPENSHMFVQVAKALKTSEGNPTAKDQALSLWRTSVKTVTEQIQNKEFNDISTSYLRNGHILPWPILRVVASFCRMNDVETFDEFWTEVIKSPLCLEMIPVMMLYLCKKDRVEEAHRLLLHLAEFPADGLYHDGINFGLNVVIMHYFKAAKNPDGITKYWRQVYDIMNDINPSLQVNILPQVADHFAQRIPPFAYSELYKLFLRRKVNIKDKRLQQTLKKFANTNEFCRRLIINTDFVVQQDSNTSDPVFCRDFYKFLFKRLIKLKDSERTAWFLDSLLAKHPEVMPIDDLMKLLLWRSIELDEIPVIGIVYESLLEKGLKPTKDILVNMCRGFRIRGLEEKCWEIIKLIEREHASNYETRSADMRNVRMEILTLIKDQYPSQTTVEYYENLFPGSEKLLEQLGIPELAKQSRISSTTPDYVPSQAMICTDTASEGFDMLSVVYQSVLLSLNDQMVVSHLYQKYRNYLLSNSGKKADLFIIGAFLDSLCRVRDSRSVSIANIIFEDSVNTLTFKSYGKSHGSFPAIARLCKANCIYNDIEAARKIVSIVESNPRLFVMNSELISPLIRFYVKKNDKASANSWIEYAEYYGIILNDPSIAEAVQSHRERHHQEMEQQGDQPQSGPNTKVSID